MTDNEELIPIFMKAAQGLVERQKRLPGVNLDALNLVSPDGHASRDSLPAKVRSLNSNEIA